MIDVLLEHVPADPESAQAYHVLFAGGIHDALSASMVAVMAAPLAERGVRIGVLMGTAYLFTEEAVASGAIVRGFQEEGIRCDRTVLLETGPGYATRCAETPYVEAFLKERRRLAGEGKSAEEIRLALEELNLGRLRIASKGTARRGRMDETRRAPLTTLSEEEQRAQGMYMIGQVAALRCGVTTMADLHHDVAVGSSRRLEIRPEWPPGTEGAEEPSCAGKASTPSDVAIIGMSCILPKAPNLRAYWHNILKKVNAIIEIPAERWDWKRYYDPDPKARDKVYSRWGGFIDDVSFDPMSYGMPPSSLASIEPLQLLVLEAVRAALKNAGYFDRAFDRERVSVILGAGGAGDLGQLYGFRSGLPQFFGDSAPGLIARLDGILPQWTEDSFAGILMNVAAGRVANRFDFGGANYTVDAACASSLAAVQLAVKELEGHTSDMVIVGGADTFQSPFTFLCFSKTYALSPSGVCRPFDERADGITISEGVGIVILKRLADAERDGDRIYAVIKGVGGASDGRDKGLTAPRPEGQVRALRRAYATAGISPASVGLIEAHGTGTVVGDRTELEALRQVFDDARAAPQSCAVGSVKSMIGHTKNTAGVASLIKTALALHHKLLPPSINVEKPNPKLRSPEIPFYVNTETRPWIHGTSEHPRRAGVSAFGFGGTNFHAVLEEYTGDYLADPARVPLQQRPSELLLWRGETRQDLLDALERLQRAFADGAQPSLPDLAFTLARKHGGTGGGRGQPALTLAVVAASLTDLQVKLLTARESLANPAAVRVADPRGIYFAERPLAREGKLAFLFPGQGSQYTNMLLDLAVNFPEVREHFERADRVLKGVLPRLLSAYIFPPPGFSQEEGEVRLRELTQTNVAQPAVGAADLALFHLLESLGVHADFLAGHSFGEYVALCAAGVFREEDLFLLSEARGRLIVEAAGEEPGGMVAVEADPEAVRRVVAGTEGVVLANLNAPGQTVISGDRSALERVVERFQDAGIRSRPVPVACAFHSPIVAPAREKLATFLSSIGLRPPRVDVYSNTTAAPHSRDPQAIAAQLVEHLVRPVRFAEEIEALYAAGTRIFVEVGPRNVLCGLTDQILGERPHLAVATDQPGRPATVQLVHALGRLAAEGVPVRLERLFDGVSAEVLDLRNLPRESNRNPYPPGIWRVNGGRARPASQDPGSGGLGAASMKDPSGVLATRLQGAGSESAGLPVPTPQSPEPPGAPREIVAAPPAASRKSEEVAQVVSQFQQLMHRFLDVQRNVMLAFLRNQPAGVGPETETIGNLQETLKRFSESGPGLREVTAPLGQAVPSRTAPPSGREESAPADSQEEGIRLLRDEKELTSRLVQLVSERTGYPPEMLGLDLDLEADLGIDSIKRVEILGDFQRRYSPPGYSVSEREMDKLTAIRTLRGIIDWVSKSLRPTEPVTPPDAFGARKDGGGGPVDCILARYTLVPVEKALTLPDGPRSIAGVIVLTDDETGIAQALVAALSERGHGVALVRANSETRETAPGCYTADLISPEGVAGLHDLIRQRQGAIGGLVHLLPLKPCENVSMMDLAAWRQRLRLEVKSLFNLARALGGEMRSAAQRGGACLLAATGMGGVFATGRPASAEWFPGQGGVRGLLKSLALEWPEVRVKVVDVDPREAASGIAAHLARELLAGDGSVEVGYQGERRLIRRPNPAPVEPRDPAALAIDRSWVILVTGGARGITAEVARFLAETYQPTLVLIGRSPLPDSEEAPDTAPLQTPQELKAVLMDRMRRAGRPVAAREVEAEYLRLRREREMRTNVAAMERTGARVHYFSADVRDEETFGAAIDRIYQTFGRIDGVIHGAGRIEDQLIQEKAPESFDRVFDTKVDSAFLLSRRLRSDSVKFLVFFASAAGTFGNRGQADYAAANEVLNTLALHLDVRWPARVVSINWGPWAKLGMVSPELERAFARRGVALIPPPAGCHSLDQELCYGCKGEVEVLLTVES